VTGFSLTAADLTTAGPRAVRLAGILAGGLSLALYVFTCAPGVTWQDSGIHQYRILTRTIEHSRGLALSHPLHYLLARLMVHVPVGEPASRMNLLSALCGAIGVGMVAGLVADLTRNIWAAALAAASLALAHIYWQMSVITEVYTTAAALMTIEWALLLRYVRRPRPWLICALLFVNGLHLGAHQFALLTLLPYAVLIGSRIKARRLGIRWLPAGIFAWLIGAAPNWVLLASYWARSGSLAASLRSFLFGAEWQEEVLNVRVSWDQLKIAGLTLLYCFPSLALPIGLVGLLRRARRRLKPFRLVLLAQTVLIVGFVARYPIPDVNTFFVPVCVLVAVWFGLGIDLLFRRLREYGLHRALLVVLAVNGLLPIAVYSLFPQIARSHQLFRQSMRDLSFRDEYQHFFVPWRRGDDSAARFAQAALELTGPGGWLLADSTTGPTTAYWYRVHGGPPSIRIYSERSCLNVPDWPELQPEELERFLTAGGRVIVVPGSKTRRLWGEHFRLDPVGEFWTITPTAAPR